MRVASDAVLERAAAVRSSSGKSWLELTKTDESRKAGLEFFRGARTGNGIRAGWSGK